MSGMNTRSNRSRSTDRESSGFALQLIEALMDPQVQQSFRSLIDTDKIADLVSAKLEVRFKGLHDMIETQQKRIEALEQTVLELKEKQDDSEQYSRRTSIRIAGIPETEGEDVQNKVMDMLSTIEVANPAINRVHRVGPRRALEAPPRPILCQFISYGDKAAAIRNRKHLRHRMAGVFISEDLTRKRAQLLFQARQLVKKKKLSQAWSADGRIAIKDIHNRVHPVKSEDDLKKFQ